MAQLETARGILTQLENAGFQAALVGGCVRDLLLGRPAGDFDITTAALPEQVMALFARCIPTGLRHGTVTVLCADGAYEVTTFRADGAYLDGRRPEAVCFVPSLEEDLRRRDFTVNAMAMDLRGTLHDPVGGRADLAARRIVCVGDAKTRFQEDALRMLRALRFAAQLDFVIDPDTMRALAHCADLCQKLSAERVRDELEKTLCSPRPALAGKMVELGLLAAFGLDGQHDLSALSSLPAQRTVRWAAFCRAVPGVALGDFRLEKRLIDLCTRACAAYAQAPTLPQWKRMVCDYNWETAKLVGALNGHLPQVLALEQADPCVSLKQLAVTGADFPHLRGEAVGRTLRTLLLHVLEHPQDNEKSALLRLAEREVQP